MDGAMSTATRRSARELLLFIVCFFVVWTVRATYFYAIDDAIASDALRTVYSLVVKLLLWGVPVFGYALWVRRQSPFRYLGIAILPSTRQWFKYLIIIGLFLGAQVGFETLVGGRQLSLSGVQAALTAPGLLTRSPPRPSLKSCCFVGCCYMSWQRCCRAGAPCC